MKVFGITGGVGAGKSEVLTYLGQNYDATVIQADEAGYLVMLPGGECYGEIVKLFGRQITTETCELDRKRIAEIVFQDEEKLKALNAIVHPAVKRYIKKAIAAAEKAGTEYVFVEAALLIEEKYDEICDELWYIYADEEVRKERLIEGRGYSVKKNEINARPTYMVTMEITNPVIKRVRSLVKKFRIPLNLLSPLFVFCFAVVFLAITQLNLQHANVHRKFQVPYDIRISLRLQSQNSGKTFGCGILY